MLIHTTRALVGRVRGAARHSRPWLVVSLLIGGLAETRAQEHVTSDQRAANVIPFRIEASGASLELQSDANRIAVLRATSTETPGWEMQPLATPLRDVGDLRDRLTGLRARGEGRFASPVFVDTDGLWSVPTQHILVRLLPEHARAIEDVLRSHPGDLRIAGRNVGRLSGTFRLETNARNGVETMELALQLAQDPRVKWAEASTWFSGQKSHVPNDPLFFESWGIRQVINGNRHHDMVGDVAWEETTGDPSIQILVLDDGVHAIHSDINQNGGRDFTDGPPGSPLGTIANGCDRHGTQVAGCISGIIDNNQGSGGIAPGCRVLSARVYESDINQPCNQDWSAYAESLISAIGWGLDQGARVSNNSNRHNTANLQTNAIRDAYENAYNNGMVHFAAAGNTGAQSINYPARWQWLNAVGRIDSAGSRVMSNTGSQIQFMAPGWRVLTTDLAGIIGDDNGDYVEVDGTSFSSPFAAGVAALLLSQRPTLNPAEVEWVMECTSRDLETPGWDDKTGWGLVNANSVLQFPIRRVSVDGNRGQTDFFSRNAAISNDGRFVIFESGATNLISGDSNGNRDIFIHDRHTAETHRVSVHAGSAIQSTADSEYPDISGDGLWAVFNTTASLHNSDTNGLSDVYMFERDPDSDEIYDELGQCDAFGCQFRVIWVSTDTGGGPPDGGSYSASISDDGRYVAFASAATDLILNDTNNVQDIFVYDHQTGNIERVSEGTGGAQADSDCFQPDISGNGNHVAFQSASGTLVTGVPFGTSHIYVRDRSGGTTSIASVDGNGTPGNNSSSQPALSTNGRMVTFASGASNLVMGDTNGAQDVFRHDRDVANDGIYDQPGDIATARASLTTLGQQANGSSYECEMSGNGRYVVFTSIATNLVGDDTNTTDDVFVRDMQSTTATRRLSVDRDWNQGNGSSGLPVISEDGAHVAFFSYASNLVAGDTNNAQDVFMHQCATPFSNVLISIGPQDSDVEEGDTVTMQTTSSGSPPPQYQWRFNGEEIAGAIFPAYTIVNAQLFDAGVYDCMVSNAVSSTVTPPAMLNVGPPAPRCVSHRDDDDSQEDVATMDYSDDWVDKTIVVPAPLSNAATVRLWIYGQPYNYPGQVFQAREDYQITVNGDVAQRITFDVGLLFDYADSVYAWRSVDVPWDWIQSGDNTFRFNEIGPAGSWDHNNLRFGVDTDTDHDRSWWYGNGIFNCNNNPANCTGELMVYIEVCDPAATDVGPPPSAVLHDRLRTYPNPFNPATTIRLELRQAGRVDVSVFDLRGRRVHRLASKDLPRGAHTFRWYGQDERGTRLASGVYAVRAETPQGVLRQKVVLLK